MAEGFSLVMLCHCRLATRKICLMLLREVKQLSRQLRLTAGERQLMLYHGGSCEVSVLDALDESAGEVVEEIAELMPLQDRTAAANVAVMDFQWLTGNGNGDL